MQNSSPPPSPAVSSGAYTPTLTNVANASGLTVGQTFWHRIGNVVTVSGQVLVTPAVTATQTQIGITLPVASALTAVDDLSGVAGCTSANQAAGVIADFANVRANLAFLSTGAAQIRLEYMFSYVVK